jgi:hypothetical protein
VGEFERAPIGAIGAVRSIWLLERGWCVNQVCIGNVFEAQLLKWLWTRFKIYIDLEH